MSDILIQGMEMPKTCAICKIRSCNSYCPLNIEIKFFFDPSNTGFDFCTGRHSDCPLHELPEHGDLIDRAPLVRTFNERADHEGWAYLDDEDLDDAPVIVPASEEATNDPKP